MTQFDPRDRVVLALDDMSLKRALALVAELKPRFVKVHDLVDGCGVSVVLDALRPFGVSVLCDSKFHDTPDTVPARISRYADAGATALTIHASGGVRMLKAARECAAERGVHVYAVSILTSLTAQEVFDTYGSPPIPTALRFARWAVEAGVTGLVCSAHEVRVLASNSDFSELRFLVPGVRSPGSPWKSQSRVLTPAEAIVAGAHQIIVGSEVCGDADPRTTFDSILQQVVDAQLALQVA